MTLELTRALTVSIWYKKLCKVKDMSDKTDIRSINRSAHSSQV